MTQKQLEKMYEKCTAPTSNGHSDKTNGQATASKQVPSSSVTPATTTTTTTTSVTEITAKVAGAKRKLSDSSAKISTAAAAKRAKNTKDSKISQDDLLKAMLTQLVGSQQHSSADFIQQLAKQLTPSPKPAQKSPVKQDKSKESEKKKLSPIQPRTTAKPSLPVQIKTERPESPDVQIMSVTKPGKLDKSLISYPL